MFSFLKSKKDDATPELIDETPEKSRNWFSKITDNLKKTRAQLNDGLATLFLGKKTIDAQLYEALETLLLSCDVGFPATEYLIKKITERVERKSLSDPTALNAILKEEMALLLEPYCKPIELNAKPFVILLVGMNGAGKTTSIAKLAHFYAAQGKKVMLAAGDTFRAAAIEQLQVWGDRNNVTVVAQQSGSDSASVIYDAMQSAKAKQVDILIADTAGRLHTQVHLMEELKKIKRVIQKIDDQAPHETMLVIDASIGQNALIQAQKFHEAIGLTSMTVTKLDGSAKGGMLFSITQATQLPIRFIGVGEKMDDLKPFNATTFVDALFNET